MCPVFQGRLERSALDTWVRTGANPDGVPSDAGFKSMQEAVSNVHCSLDAARTPQVQKLPQAYDALPGKT